MKNLLFLWLMMGLFSIVSVDAQKKSTTKAPESLNLIKEGKGMSGITIGKSTMDDVIKRFGKEYKWIVNKKYSFQMNYYKLGLAFYICQSDRQQEVFVLEIKKPYQAKTSKGIILGKSTAEDIRRIYGKTTSGLEYRGISFYYNKVDGKNIVTEIDVTENSGIRQCKAGK